MGGKDDIVDSLEGGCLEWPGVATLVPILAESLLEAPDLRNQNQKLVKIKLKVKVNNAMCGQNRSI